MNRFLWVLAPAVVLLGSFFMAEEVSGVEQEGMSAPQAPLAELTDTSGAVLRLRKYSLEVSDGQMQNALYGREMLVPLGRGEGIVQFFQIEAMREYQFDRTGARVVLATGETVAGKPCGNCTVEGEGPLGKVTIPFVKVKALRFDVELAPAAVKADLEKKNLEVQYFRNSERKEESATIVTSTGESYAPSWIWFNVLENYCDTNYLPCKPYSAWRERSTLKVKYGDTTNEVELGALKSLDFSSPVAPPSKAPAAGSRTLAVRVTTATGDTMDVTVDENDRPSLTGLTPTGSVLIPLRAIRSIQPIRLVEVAPGR